MAIVITAIGAVSSIWVVREGYCGFADPIPGYGDAHHQATSAFDEATDDLVEDRRDLIDDLADTATNSAEDAIEELTATPGEREAALLDLPHARDAHNADVVSANKAAKAALGRQSGIVDFVTGRGRSERAAFDPVPWDDLILPSLDDATTHAVRP